ncbi:hypothetical protein C8R48DRAFT_782522 [Suillus tomentosus]|nr:hypothetical protein C8R48DRAFT_782522 [Suillus tomentosus]
MSSSESGSSSSSSVGSSSGSGGGASYLALYLGCGSGGGASGISSSLSVTKVCGSGARRVAMSPMDTLLPPGIDDGPGWFSRDTKGLGGVWGRFCPTVRVGDLGYGLGPKASWAECLCFLEVDVLVKGGPRWIAGINVPIRFVIKTHNASLDSFKKDIGHEVFVIGGQRKGYRGTLDSLSLETCTVAVRGQVRATLKLHDVVTKYGMRLNGVMLEGPELSSFCDMRKRSYLAPPPRSVTPPVEQIPSSSLASITDPSLPSSNGWSEWSASPSSVDVEHDPSSSANPSSSSAMQAWSVDELDVQDSIEASTEKLRDTGPLPWLMSKEFSSELLGYHVLFKVSVGFMNGRLQRRFVSTACPDLFCGENGPAPEGCVAVFCTSNSAGAAIEHYHIPASDLSPAPPRKKNQECLILDGVHHGLIQTIAKCEIAKKNTVDIKITPTVTVTLCSDQICLVERTRQ